MLIPKNIAPSSDKMAVFISELQAATSVTKKRQDGHWIGIRSVKLKILLGSEYRGVIVDCLEAGFIEVNERYSEGKFSKSYRLSKRYRTPQIATYQVKRRSAKERIRLDEQDVTGRLVASWFPSAEIDTKAAEIDTKAAGWTLYSVQSIQSQRWYASRCQYGRLHSSFTALPKKIRQRLKLDGEKVAELDISNCQALILGQLAANNQQPTTNQPNPTTNHPHTICRTNGDLEIYNSIAGSGKIYDHLLHQFSDCRLFDLIPPERRHSRSCDRALARRDIKKQFILIMFSNVPMMKQLFIWPRFESEFPTVASFIEQQKLDHGYQSIARSCQRFESQIMIDTVAGELAKVIPIITVHDSIVCRQQDIDRVTQALESGFVKNGITEVTINLGF